MTKNTNPSAESQRPLDGAIIAFTTAFLVGVLGIAMALAAQTTGLSPVMTLGGLTLWLALSITASILMAAQLSRPQETPLPVRSTQHGAPPPR